MCNVLFVISKETSHLCGYNSQFGLVVPVAYMTKEIRFTAASPSSTLEVLSRRKLTASAFTLPFQLIRGKYCGNKRL